MRPRSTSSSWGRPLPSPTSAGLYGETARASRVGATRFLPHATRSSRFQNRRVRHPSPRCRVTEKEFRRPADPAIGKNSENHSLTRNEQRTFTIKCRYGCLRKFFRYRHDLLFGHRQPLSTSPAGRLRHGLITLGFAMFSHPRFLKPHWYVRLRGRPATRCALCFVFYRFRFVCFGAVPMSGGLEAR